MSKKDDGRIIGSRYVTNFNLPPKAKPIAPAKSKKPKAVISSTTIIIPKPRPAAPAVKYPRVASDGSQGPASPPKAPRIASDTTGQPPRKYKKISSDTDAPVSASKEKSAWFRMAKDTSPDTPGGLAWKLQSPKLGVYKNGGKVRGDGMSKVKTKGKCC